MINDDVAMQVWGLHASTGTVAWEKRFVHDMQTSSPVVQSDGSFLIGSVDHRLYAMQASTGKVLWEWKAPVMLILLLSPRHHRVCCRREPASGPRQP